MVVRTLDALAADIGGEVVGDGTVEISGVAGIREAGPGDLTFLANSRYDGYLDDTKAAAVICAPGTRRAAVPQLLVPNPYLAFQRIVRVFRPEITRQPAGVHPTAVVAADVRLGADVSVGPHCVVEPGATLGDRVTLMPGCYIGHAVAIGSETLFYPRVVVREECVIGERCILHPGVVVGSDGFGFALDGGRYHKVPQVGNVIIGDDVEIGANTTIDRATTASTRIGDGTKIDNLVQIGHNVVIGRHCIVVSQVGISGSTELEDFVTLAGQVGVAGHLTIGKGATIGAQSGVARDVPGDTIMSGSPVMPHSMWRRMIAILPKLPQLFQRARDLEERVDKLEHKNASEQVR